MRTWLKRKRSKPRRVRGREKLYGKAKEARRREIFERSGGRCENRKAFGDLILRCNAPISWWGMEWSHKRHGANKCDCLDCGIASCRECHQIGKHNPKPCPPKETEYVSLHSIYCDCQTCKERKDARAKSD